MSDKIWEDIYSQLKEKWWGTLVIFSAVIFIVLLSVWNSLPDTTKEELLNSEESSAGNMVNVVKQLDTSNQDKMDIPVESRIVSILTFKKQYLPKTTTYGGDGKGCDSWVTEELEPKTLNVNLIRRTIWYTYESHRLRGWGNCHGTKWDDPGGSFVGKVSAVIKIIDNKTIYLNNFSDDTDYTSPSSKGLSLVNHLKLLDGSIIK